VLGFFYLIISHDSMNRCSGNQPQFNIDTEPILESMIMEKVVSIQDRIKSQKQKRRLEQYQRRVDTIQKVTHCSACHLKCAMCGQYLEVTEVSTDPYVTRHEYVFCESCRAEFEDFLALSQGVKKNQVLWHNKEWKRMWSAWVQYRQSITDFVNSKEYQLLLEEPDTHP